MLKEIKIGKLYRDKRYSSVEVIIVTDRYENHWKGPKSTIVYHRLQDPEDNRTINEYEAQVVWEELDDPFNPWETV